MMTKRLMNIGTKICSLILGAALAMTGDALGEDVAWVSGGGGVWSDGANWDTGTPPGEGDNALITLDGTYTVVLDLDATVLSLTLGGTSGTQTLDITSQTLDLDGSSTIGANGKLILNSGTINITNAPDMLTNSGQLFVRGTTAIGGSGTFSNAADATLRIDHPNSGSGVLTVAEGFTNDGLIELDPGYYYASAILNVTNGALVNTNTIDVLAGGYSGTVRQINAEIDNQGTINIHRTTTSDVPGAVDHTNSGTINCSAGHSTFTLTDDTFTNSGAINLTGGYLTFSSATDFDNTASGEINLVDGGAGGLTISSTMTVTNTGTIGIGDGKSLSVSGTTFDYPAGSIGGLGTLSISGMTINAASPFTNSFAQLQLSSSTWNGPGSLTSTTSMMMSNSTILTALANQGSLVAEGNCTIDSPAGTFTNEGGATLQVVRTNGVGDGILTVLEGFTNEGTIELASGYAYNGAILNVTNGTLVNANTIDVLAGGTSSTKRQINAEIDNQGTINNYWALTVDMPGAADHVNSGTINTAGSGLAFTLTGDTFTNSGTINLTGGTLTLNSADQITNTGTGTIEIGSGRSLAVSDTTFDYQGGSISGQGTLSVSDTTVNLDAPFSNSLEQLTLSSCTCNGPGALTNTTSMTMSACTINPPFANQGALLARGSCAINSPEDSFTNEAGATLRIDYPGQGNGVLTVAEGFTNDGLIELASGHHYAGAILNVSNGTLVNTDTIDVLAGGFWSTTRQINAEIDNQGTINTYWGTTVDKPGAADHLNSGTINVTEGNLTVTLTDDTFTNNGTIDVSPERTLSVGGDYPQGATGTYAAEIGPSGHGIMQVSETATLDGTLDIVLVDSFVPELGSTFDVMTYAGWAGGFVDLQGEIIGGGLVFEVEYTANAVRLTVVVGADGDFDGDGDVDFDDFVHFCDCMAGPDVAPDPTFPTTEAECLDAFDADGDGDIDLSDGGGFQRRFQP